MLVSLTIFFLFFIVLRVSCEGALSTLIMMCNLTNKLPSLSLDVTHATVLIEAPSTDCNTFSCYRVSTVIIVQV